MELRSEDPIALGVSVAAFLFADVSLKPPGNAQFVPRVLSQTVSFQVLLTSVWDASCRAQELESTGLCSRCPFLTEFAKSLSFLCLTTFISR